jgi:hypothetical protein
MPKTERRGFGQAFKLELIKRLEAGESGTALALEFSVKRTIIHRWRDAHRRFRGRLIDFWNVPPSAPWGPPPPPFRGVVTRGPGPCAPRRSATPGIA